MTLNKTAFEQKKQIKDVLGSVYVFLSKFGSAQSDVQHLFEMYFGKPEREWGVLGEAYYWKLRDSGINSKAASYLRVSYRGTSNKKTIEVHATVLSKKEYEDGNAEARYYQTGFGGTLPNSKIYSVRDLDEAIDCYIDISNNLVKSV